MKNKLFFKYGLAVLVMLVSIPTLFAQEATKSQAIENMSWFGENMIFILGVVVLLAGCFAVLNVFNNMVKLERMKLLEEKGLLTSEAVVNLEKESAWQRLMKQAWNRASVEEEKDILLEHPHDGIYELDNKLPPWWLALFYITIAYGVFYIGYKHFTKSGEQLNQEQKYIADVERAEIKVKEYLAAQGNAVDETNVAMLDDEARIEAGGKIFVEQCAACHGALGQGGIGPNMTDAYWLHGGSIKDVFSTIKYGVPDKGMISWKESLTASQMNEVASYILTLQGTNPPGAKEPQGELYTSSASDEEAAGDEESASEEGSEG